MDGWNRGERLILRWLSNKPIAVALLAPLVVFWLFDFSAVAVISQIAGRGWWPRNPYEEWLVTAGTVAMAASFWVAALGSTTVFVRTRRFKLLELYQTTWDMRQMSWREFEDLVAACYQFDGFQVELLGGLGRDGGRDVIVRRDGETWFVQCKHYRDSWVAERPLRELLGVADARGATGGVLVTCGVFDKDAVVFAGRTPRLKLIDGDQLLEWASRILGTNRRPVVCPKCGGRIVVKDGRRGLFLGCRRYPACVGTMDLPYPARVATFGTDS